MCYFCWIANKKPNCRAKLIKSYPNSRKNSPNRTPIKKSVTTDLRLRPDKKLEDEILRISDRENKPHTLHVPGEDNETSV